ARNRLGGESCCIVPAVAGARLDQMYFQPPEDRGGGGRERAGSLHQAADGAESPAAGGANIMGSAPATFCPSPISPTRPPSALAAAAAGAAFIALDERDSCDLGHHAPSALDDSTTGRAPSSDNIDLGWGAMGNALMEEDRDGEAEEAGEGYSCAATDDAQRPLTVPDIDPHWSFDCAVGGETRSARARSSSFYEGDDADMLACINGEAPPENKSSRRSFSVTDVDDLLHGGGSGGGGSFSPSCDLDEMLRPTRGRTSGLTASQAAAARSAAAPVLAAAAGGV
ncbi:unnamed protein product, partial [Ectocarpus sp. 12 AP-2014]